jgi:HTH-type transcriptional regulator/antitoxin MqsA
MRCNVCGSNDLVHDKRDLPYQYMGQFSFIPAVAGDYCSVCSEVILSAAEASRVNALMLAFNEQVNVAIATKKSPGIGRGF